MLARRCTLHSAYQTQRIYWSSNSTVSISTVRTIGTTTLQRPHTRSRTNQLTQTTEQTARRTMSQAASITSTELSPLPNVQIHSPRVISILGQNPGVMTLQGTNTYLIGAGEHRILIDAGEGIEAYTEQLKEQLKANNISQLTILLTHWHADHTGGVKSVCDLFDTSHQPSVHKFSGADLLPRQVVAAFPNLPKIIQPIDDGSVFRVEGATLKAIHTPGHTTDHCVFILEEESAVLSGDTILGASTAVFQDLHAYMHSLKRIAACQPKRIYPAHGPIIDGPEAPQRVEQYLQHRTQREAQILATMKSMEDELEGKSEEEKRCDYPTAAQLVQRICTWHGEHPVWFGVAFRTFYGLLTVVPLLIVLDVGLSANLITAAANNVLLHLDKLQKEGRVEPITETPNQSIEEQPTIEPTIVDEDDCKAEVAKLHAIAMQRSKWRWKLTA